MFCPACGAELGEEARYCGSCGVATRKGRRATRSELRARRLGENRAGWILGLVFAGSLFAVFAPSALLGDDYEWGWQTLTITVAVDLLVYLAGFALLQRKRRVEVWGQGWGELRHHARAAGLGLACFALAWGYSLLLEYGLFSGLEAEVETQLELSMIVAIVLVAPLLEEMLCRGIAFQAALEFGGHRSAIVLTAILFAILHGANGGFVLEFPHRFLGGLMLGWLRWHTGALAPCILAHFVWNAAAVATMS